MGGHFFSWCCFVAFFGVAGHGCFADDHDVADCFDEFVGDDDSFCAAEYFVKRRSAGCAYAPAEDFVGGDDALFNIAEVVAAISEHFHVVDLGHFFDAQHGMTPQC